MVRVALACGLQQGRVRIGSCGLGQRRLERRHDGVLSAGAGVLVASGARYVSGHGLVDRAPAVLAGTVVLRVVYAAPRRRATRKPATRAAAWCAVLLTTWLVLVVLAPSFASLAVPLSFVALRVLPFAAAGAVVAGMTVAVVVACTLMQGRLDPTIVAGPACVAGLAVIAYRTLEREAAARLQLLGALQEAQGDLVDAQHSAGVLAERTRLSREIHDSVAQGFSSINLLLQAAEQAWDDRPDAAREHMAQAAGAAREGLEDVRRVVRDLAPADIMSGGTGPALMTALRSTCERGVRGSHVSVSVRVDGRPVDVPADVATAVLRTAHEALANVGARLGHDGGGLPHLPARRPPPRRPRRRPRLRPAVSGRAGRPRQGAVRDPTPGRAVRRIGGGRNSTR